MASIITDGRDEIVKGPAQILDMHGNEVPIRAKVGFTTILEAPEDYEMRFFAGWFWALSPKSQPLKLADNGRTWKKVDINSKDGAECLHIIRGLITF